MRYLLAILIFFLTTSDVFGLAQSIAPGLSGKNAIMYLIMLALAGRFVMRGGMKLELPQIHLWLGILVAYAILTWLACAIVIGYQSYTLIDSGIALKAQLLDNVVIFVLYLYGTRTMAESKFVLKCILLAVTIANAIAIGNAAGLFHIGVTPIGTEGNLNGRVFGAFGHANETGALIDCLLPALIAAALSAEGMIGRIFWGGCAAVSAALMVMTGSRGAFVGLVMGAALGTYLCYRMISWRRAAALVGVCVLLAIPMLILVSIKFNGILTSRVIDMIMDPSTHGDERTYIWMPVIDRMMRDPISLITGFGWNSYSVMGFFYVAHNHYLLLWFELGIIGLLSYLLVLRQLITTARRAAQRAPAETSRYLIAFIYGIIGLSTAVFFTLIFKPWIYVWAYVGVTMRMAVLALNAARTSDKQPRKRKEASRRGAGAASPESVREPHGLPGQVARRNI